MDPVILLTSNSTLGGIISSPRKWKSKEVYKRDQHSRLSHHHNLKMASQLNSIALIGKPTEYFSSELENGDFVPVYFGSTDEVSLWMSTKYLLIKLVILLALTSYQQSSSRRDFGFRPRANREVCHLWPSQCGEDLSGLRPGGSVLERSARRHAHSN